MEMRRNGPTLHKGLPILGENITGAGWGLEGHDVMVWIQKLPCRLPARAADQTAPSLRLTQPFQQGGGGFVGGILGDEFAAEGFGEDGGRQALHGLLRAAQPRFDPVRVGEQGFDAADDFLLFGEGWDWKNKLLEVFA